MTSLAALPLAPRPARVVGVRRESHDVVTLTIEASLPPPSPGQFNMLYAFGVGEAPISTSGDSTAAGPLVHTIKAVGAVTRALCALGPDTTLGVRGPFGTAWPLAEAAGGDLLVVAGGLGLAPLRPVVYHALARRDDYGLVTLAAGARTPADLLYKGELAAWADRGISVLRTVDRATAGWDGRVGVVPALLTEAPISERTVALVCGPEVMMRYAVRELGRRGLPDDRIWVSLERNMKCAVGLCGHCQFGPSFVCKDGPVFRYDRVRALFSIAEV
ncbi:MAG: FAD/NAD(P)-binding protein [Myxococcales bacterium]|nr:FAD/NAD(P)-binding protein [Myxococcales bacterium]